ncbi:MAG: 2Fe-2S iron-sulfur cluster-binding protein, partial [Pseudomonadota bacterium]
MSARLPSGGRLIDRTKPRRFFFNGKPFKGFAGDTVASALLANDQMLVGRSFKYHRPRGIVAAGPEEPNALLNMGRGARFEPNQRATTTELFEGLAAESQNHWPSLEFDVGSVNQAAASLLPAGFYYKTFIHPRPAWKHLFEPFIRQSAGLGKAPKKADTDRYEHFYWHTDILIVGGGVAGLQAALTAAETGLRITLVEQTAHWGGRAPVDGEVIDGQPADDWVKAALATLAQYPNVTLRPRLMGAGVYDHGYVLGYERVADHSPESDAPRHRLWKIRAKQIITATGAIERPLSFPYNDVPGVMLASAVRDYAVNFGVAAGQRSIVVTNNDDAYLTALALHGAGQTVPLILDARPTGGGALADRAADLGIRVRKGAAIAAVRGRTRVQAVTVA